ncbi:MAG: alginate lyase family protein [Saprospiraceae bacterium]|nr:alginate lyase family protein [Saprospiraceae bacterium]
MQALQAWAASYLEWLTTDELALAEAASKNNHGTFYDVQVLYFALYTDNHKKAIQIANGFWQNRIREQIRPDGTMPEELARTRPLFYSIFNLHAMYLAAHLAESVGVDLWQAEQPTSRLRAALDNLLPYADPQKAWPTATVSEVNRMELYALLQLADRAYPDGAYLEHSQLLPSEDRSVDRSHLVLPFMR